MRSLLFVPGDSRRKFDKARQCEADALILDLEDSVALGQKEAARQETAGTLEEPRTGQHLFVRVNALDTGLTLQDLAAVMPLRPDGIVLPKSESGADVSRLGFYLDAFEAAHGHRHGSTRILAIVTETARSIAGLPTYPDCSPRLWGMLWGGEDMAADLGAFGNRRDGRYTGPYRTARDMCLISARAARVEPIDAVYTDVKDTQGLRTETEIAKFDGFTAKAVIHPGHVDVVNAAFTPDENQIAWARRIVQAFADAPDAGVVNIDGKMIDRPHLRQADRVLARVGRA
ncbi:MAG: CoA ester lyase [Gammaproteobacteria bacterium]|nr:CoA ester lyase [Gammaproteobacteria bacterium]MBU1443146.1 CoA ester lyase [Gammaproteobacteria bacterium]MBU2288164.1 CoA ester lyase [Gammaproteobacteria bacterium]MBU2409538.1 CoA ester lyase [Gammaproteobacteria bacterium]